MACEDRTIDGRDVELNYWIACPEADPSGATWLRLGFMNSKDITATWGTREVGGDTNVDVNGAANTDNIATNKSVAINGEYIAMGTDIANQLDLEELCWSPGAATSFKPYVWLQIVFPNKMITVPCVLTENGFTAPTNDTTTGSISAVNARAGTFERIVV